MNLRLTWQQFSFRFLDHFWNGCSSGVHFADVSRIENGGNFYCVYCWRAIQSTNKHEKVYLNGMKAYQLVEDGMRDPDKYSYHPFRLR